jgi:GT2 family glycosyltransferase
MDVSLVIVSYNNGALLRTCLRSVAGASSGAQIETIVVDNGSTDDSVGMVRNEFPEVRIVANAENRGFAAANNQGILLSRGRYVLLLNPDTEVHEGAVTGVMDFLDARPTVWVAGCRLLNADGSVQPSAGAFPSVLEALLKGSFLYLLLPRGAIITPRGVQLFDNGRASRVDWVMGAFFMIRREALDRIGVLDDQFFMYSEEVDFCRRVRDAGHEVWYTPAGTTTHFWGGMNAVGERTLLWLAASQILYIRKHHRGAERSLLVFLKYAGLALRAVAYGVGGIVAMNKKLLAKSGYVASAMGRLLTTPIADLWRP